MINSIDGVIDPDKLADDSDVDVYHDLKEFIVGTHKFVTEDYETRQADYVTAQLKQFKMDLKLEDRFKQSSQQINLRAEMNMEVMKSQEARLNQLIIDLKDEKEREQKAIDNLRKTEEEALADNIG